MQLKIHVCNLIRRKWLFAHIYVQIISYLHIQYVQIIGYLHIQYVQITIYLHILYVQITIYLHIHFDTVDLWHLIFFENWGYYFIFHMAVGLLYNILKILYHI